jgi:hypothetical protein
VVTCNSFSCGADIYENIRIIEKVGVILFLKLCFQLAGVAETPELNIPVFINVRFKKEKNYLSLYNKLIRWILFYSVVWTYLAEGNTELSKRAGL